jgi:tetratricopeptide (TPR) repeat protein
MLPASRLKFPAPLALVLLAAAMASGCYLQALHYPLVSDDIAYVAENSRLAGLRFVELWRLFLEPYSPHFEFLPLREFSYWLDLAWFGASPAALRIHNLLLYLLTLPLVYGATLGLWRYFRPADASAPWAAAAVTALYAVHPALVESVVWVSGRKYVLPNFFSALTLWLAVRAGRENGFSQGYAAAALLAFAAVMLSKSSYVSVALIVALLWLRFWLDLPQPRRRALLLWPLAILALGALLLRVFIAKNQGFDSAPFYFGVEAVTRTLAVLGGLARLCLTPEGRHFLYPVFEDPLLPWMAALGVIVLLAAGWGMAALARRRPVAGFALVFFLLLCLPYLQLVPAKPPSLIADRYVALAAWPAMLFVVALAWRLRPFPRAALLLALALPFLYHSAVRPRDWQSDKTLIGTDVRAFPGYYMPATYMAWDIQVPDWLHQDALATANSIRDAEVRNFMARLVEADHAVFVRAEKTGSPREALPILVELNALLKRPPAHSRWDTPIRSIWRGGQDAVESEWQALAERFPGDASVRYSAGLWLLDISKHESAASHLHAAILSQQLPEAVRGAAYGSLGLALIGAGRLAEAEAPLLAALEQVPPDSRAHCLLAKVYGRSGRREEEARAVAACRNSRQE